MHLETDTRKIAVEIAVTSRPELEIAHIKHCLACGYDQVFGIFVDEHLLKRTQAALTKEFSQEERGKVRLLPVSRLSHLG